jgi:hypothetical protein
LINSGCPATIELKRVPLARRLMGLLFGLMREAVVRVDP